MFSRARRLLLRRENRSGNAVSLILRAPTLQGPGLLLKTDTAKYQFEIDPSTTYEGVDLR